MEDSERVSQSAPASVVGGGVDARHCGLRGSYAHLLAGLVVLATLVLDVTLIVYVALVVYVTLLLSFIVVQTHCHASVELCLLL